MAQRLRRSRNLDDKKRVLYHRFGSLEDFSSVRMTIQQIAAKLYMPWSTVRGIITRFVAAGYRFSAFERAQRRFGCIKAEIQEKLLDAATLREWKPYSLRERLIMMDRLWNVKISFNTLQCFYKSHSLSYKSCKAVYRTYLERQPHLDAERRRFALLLANLLEKKVPIIYQDETTCNSFFVKSKSWSLRGQRNVHHRDNKRFSVTIFGALSEALQGNFCYMFGGGTTAREYQQFLKLCKGKIRLDVGANKCVLLYDGHPAHTGQESMRLCERLFWPLKNVAYSSELNSIESLWSLVKNNLKKLLLMQDAPLTKPRFEQLVRQAIELVTPRQHSNILRANHACLTELLQQL